MAEHALAVPENAAADKEEQPSTAVAVKEEPAESAASPAVKLAGPGPAVVKGSFSAIPQIDPSDLRGTATQAMKGVIAAFGGPMQYLCAKHGESPATRAAFAEYLNTQYPPLQDCQYQSDSQSGDASEFYVRLSDLTFTKDATTKPPPFSHTVLSLVDEFVVNTFVTDGPAVSECCVKSNHLLQAVSSI